MVQIPLLMKKRMIYRIIFVTCFSVWMAGGQLAAQQLNGQPATAREQQQATTIIMLRHAEKVADGSKDPHLTEEGQQRAKAYARIFGLLKPDAIYSSNYHRTISTAKPLAEKHEMDIQIYDPREQPSFLDKLLRDHPGGTVVVVGHSNSLPAAANYLLKQHVLEELPETEYSKVFVLSVMPDGSAKLLPLLLEL